MTGTLDRIEAYWKRADNLPDIRRDVLALVEAAKAALEQDASLELLNAEGHEFVRIDEARIDPVVLARLEDNQ